MKKFLIIFLVWFISIIYSIIWTFENPEKIEKIKSIVKKNKSAQVEVTQSKSQTFIANSFNVNVTQVLKVSDKTAFIINNSPEEDFNLINLDIYTQKGFLINNLKQKKIKLPNYFTLQRNGGVKTIISLEDKKFAFISGSQSNCFFAALIEINSGKEVFRSQCLPEIPKNNDFNGLGSSNVHYEDKILLSVGTPEKHVSKNSLLAQKNDSIFGKILEIDKTLLKNAIDNNSNGLDLNFFSKGHRVPQGLTIMKNKIFNVEHGPKGGDELNLVIKGQNYGWPNVSYGTNYLLDNGGDGSSYLVNHKKNGFKEPLFAFVPSIGISSLNNCPKILNEYYKKPCLIALSLYGNNLRKGYSLIIFLLNEKMNKVDSIEKILLNDLVLRHFVTDEKNTLYEDKKGNIYVSVDKKGIYKINFSNFR